MKARCFCSIAFDSLADMEGVKLMGTVEVDELDLRGMSVGTLAYPTKSKITASAARRPFCEGSASAAGAH